VAQDSALSRRRQGFDSPTGYFRGYGSALHAAFQVCTSARVLRAFFVTFFSERSRVTSTPGKFLGFVRIWQDGEEWRWCAAGKWAPENAELADRYRGADGEEVIHLNRGDAVEYIRGAVKAD
jgi:hypothetical protein